MTIRIGVGPGLGGALSVDEYWRWLELCESSGIDSVWHSDQLIGPGLEPMAMMAALAARTKRMRFGTNAVVVSHRDPLVLAKECATIDFLSKGRLLPVFGVGNAADPVWAAVGASSKGRGKRANEAIALIRRLLSEDSVSFHGEYYRYENAQVLPRPAKPIPIWIGGHSEAAIQRTAALGDGWLGGLIAADAAGDVVTRIKAALLLTGRTIDEDHYGVVVPFRFGSAEDQSVRAFCKMMNARRGEDDGGGAAGVIAAGGAAELVAAFRQYIDAGISKFVAIPIAGDAQDMFEQTQLLAREIVPVVEK
ncbi:MAG: LLM class flavin-dependent oxidoreductase [Caulobacterales bacterium]